MTVTPHPPDTPSQAAKKSSSHWYGSYTMSVSPNIVGAKSPAVFGNERQQSEAERRRPSERKQGAGPKYTQPRYVEYLKNHWQRVRGTFRVEVDRYRYLRERGSWHGNRQGQSNGRARHSPESGATPAAQVPLCRRETGDTPDWPASPSPSSHLITPWLYDSVPNLTSSVQSPPQKLTAGETTAAPRLLASLLTVDHSAAACAGVRLACVDRSPVHGGRFSRRTNRTHGRGTPRQNQFL